MSNTFRRTLPVSIACLLTVAALGLSGCNSPCKCALDGANGTGGANGDGGHVTNPATCDPDPLHTGLTDYPHTDDFDCLIIQLTQKYNEPDAMIFKAVINAESHFDYQDTACTNYPCQIPPGWTDTESQCFGLMQIVLACSPKPGDLGLLPNGHPNLTTDPNSAQWATSIYNPAVNIERGIAGIADNRQQVMASFPGCTEEQYTLMAIGNYNNYGSTTSCTSYNTAYDDPVLARYKVYCDASGWNPHAY